MWCFCRCHKQPDSSKKGKVKNIVRITVLLPLPHGLSRPGDRPHVPCMRAISHVAWHVLMEPRRCHAENNYANPCAQITKSCARITKLCARISNPCARLSNPCTRFSNPCARFSNPCARISVINSCARITKPCTWITKPCARITKPCARITKPCARITKPCARIINPCAWFSNPCARHIQVYINIKTKCARISAAQ